jgi:hypothetical protein
LCTGLPDAGQASAAIRDQLFLHGPKFAQQYEFAAGEKKRAAARLANHLKGSEGRAPGLALIPHDVRRAW